MNAGILGARTVVCFVFQPLGDAFPLCQGGIAHRIEHGVEALDIEAAGAAVVLILPLEQLAAVVIG